MIIYKDVVFGNELFTDALRLKPVDDASDCFTWVSQKTTEKQGDIQLAGANASQEEAAEDTEESVFSGFDFEIYNREITQIPEMSLKDFKLWFKQYAKKVVAAWKGKDKPEMAEKAQASAMEFFKKFGVKDKLKEVDFFSGPAQDDDELGMVYGNVIVVDWNDDGMSATCYCWRGGLEEEKC